MAVHGSSRSSSLTDRLDLMGLDADGRAKLKTPKPAIAKLMAETGEISENIIIEVTDRRSRLGDRHFLAGAVDRPRRDRHRHRSDGLGDQQNAAMVEETTAAVHSPCTRVAELVRTVSRFKAEGQVSTPAPRLAAAPRRPAPAPKSAGFAVQGNTALATGDVDGWEEF